MLVNKTGLGYRVLVAWYSEEAGRVAVGGRRGLSVVEGDRADYGLGGWAGGEGVVW
jgi:hypothetical protein